MPAPVPAYQPYQPQSAPQPNQGFVPARSSKALTQRFF